MKTTTGELLTQRERRCLWSPEELVAVYDAALGDPEVWDDVLQAAGRADSAGTVARFDSLTSAAALPRLEEPAGQPLAYLEVRGDGGTARQVAVLAELRERVDKSTVLAAVPEQYDRETLRSLRLAGADVCVCAGAPAVSTEPAVPQRLLDALDAAFAAGFTRIGLTAVAGADPRRELELVMLQSNHLMEELGLHPHTVTVHLDGAQPAADGTRDPFLLRTALLRVAHPYSNVVVHPGGGEHEQLRQLGAGANLVTGPVPPAVLAAGYRLVADVDVDPKMRELSYRRLGSMDHFGGLISEFRTKHTETYMLVRRPAGPGALGNNLHRGLYRSKDPETVVLIEGSLSITSRHPEQPEPMVAVITSTPRAPHKLTIPRDVYHEVIARTDSLLIEFSSYAEDTTDSFPWPEPST